MPAWITVYCGRLVGPLSGTDLRRGILGGDPSALAGVDYLTLAEPFDIDDEDIVDETIQQLEVVADVDPDPDLYEVRYRREELRPIVVHRWRQPDRVREEVTEVLELRDLEIPDPRLADRLRDSREVVGIELGFSQLEDMGVVVGYEIARYLAQRGDGLVLDEGDRWVRVVEGAFVPVARSNS